MHSGRNSRITEWYSRVQRFHVYPWNQRANVKYSFTYSSSHKTCKRTLPLDFLYQINEITLCPVRNVTGKKHLAVSRGVSRLSPEGKGKGNFFCMLYCVCTYFIMLYLTTQNTFIYCYLTAVLLIPRQIKFHSSYIKVMFLNRLFSWQKDYLEGLSYFILRCPWNPNVCF